MLSELTCLKRTESNLSSCQRSGAIWYEELEVATTITNCVHNVDFIFRWVWREDGFRLKPSVQKEMPTERAEASGRWAPAGVRQEGEHHHRAGVIPSSLSLSLSTLSLFTFLLQNAQLY